MALSQHKRDLILLLAGIFLSFTVQTVYDSIREFPIYQSVDLVIRTDVLAIIFGIATLVTLGYLLHKSEGK